VLCDAAAVFPEVVEVALPEWSGEHQERTETNLPGTRANQPCTVHDR
jgi:hypothetical protein